MASPEEVEAVARAMLKAPFDDFDVYAEAAIKTLDSLRSGREPGLPGEPSEKAVQAAIIAARDLTLTERDEFGTTHFHESYRAILRAAYRVDSPTREEDS